MRRALILSPTDPGMARLATQAEAEAGTNNDKISTPLRVAQAIASLGVLKTGGTFTGDVAVTADLEVGSGVSTTQRILSVAQEVGGTSVEAWIRMLGSAVSIERRFGSLENGIFSFDGQDVYYRPNGGTDMSIAEYGTNANGSYVRYYNGVQLCFMEDSTSVSAASFMSDTLTLPAAFSGASYIVVATQGSNSGGYWNMSTYTYTTTGFSYTLRHIDASSATGNLVAYFIVFGRWY